MKEMPFVQKKSASLLTSKGGGAGVKNGIWVNFKNKSRQSSQKMSTDITHTYSEQQVLPLVVREVSALARQRIKIREPTDFLKIQQRIKTDLDSMNHSNAFFRQRYSAQV